MYTNWSQSLLKSGRYLPRIAANNWKILKWKSQSLLKSGRYLQWVMILHIGKRRKLSQSLLKSGRYLLREVLLIGAIEPFRDRRNRASE